MGPIAGPLSTNGHATVVAVTAVMRKLLHLAFGVLKHGRPFDSNYHPAHP
ncbi:MAG: hypothetical protein ABSD48_11930 [Armatimonadota bacterium]|jgi:hypothetical protein